MPKRVKKRRASRDVNEIAFDLGRQTAALMEGPVAEQPTFKAQLSAYMSKLGAKGGKVSGARRLENLTDEQRRKIASDAARARWAKRKAVKKR